MARVSQDVIDFKFDSLLNEISRVINLEEDVEMLISLDPKALVLYCMYYLQLTEKPMFREEFKKRNKEHQFNDTIKEMIEEEYIAEIHIKNEISRVAIVCMEETNITIVNMVADYDCLADYIDATKGEIISGCRKSINQHTSLEHYASISALMKLCDRENIKYLYKPEDVVLKIENKVKRMRKTYTKSEFDIVMIYNQKKLYTEVERGTTSYNDMVSKMDKINLLLKEVVIACPNQKALNATKEKIERWENEYEDRLRRGEIEKVRNLKILYVNLSAIKDKKGKKLGNKLKDFMKKDFYLIK